MTLDKKSIFGEYQSIDHVRLAGEDDQVKGVVQQVENEAKKSALSTVSLLPAGLFVFYLILLIYFKRKGGYKPVDISTNS
jgi:hypothetical protein